MSHILSAFERELNQLKESVLMIGRLVISQTDEAVHGLQEGDRERCSDVLDQTDEVEEWEAKVDRAGMELLMRYSPVASDLRFVFSSVNVGRSLERIGAHAASIARRSRKLLKEGRAEEIELLGELYLDVKSITSLALQAYSDQDASISSQVITFDERIDKSYKQITKRLSKLISEGHARAQALIELLFICRSLERIGDLAVKVAEDVIFMASPDDSRLPLSRRK